jgi:hypothetical protein
MRLNVLNINTSREVVSQPIRVDPLCRKCKYAHVERGYNAGEVRLLCGLNGGLNEPLFVVRECTDYTERRVPAARVRVGFVRS